MKVMLALDDSKHSEYALDSVLHRPWPDDVEFLVFMVYEPYHPDFAGWDQNSIDQAVKYARGMQETAMAYVQRSADKLSSHFSTAKVITEVKESGHITEMIIEEATNWPADLIIMGSHGRKGFERFLLGSVSQAVVAHAPCSVEIIKRPLKGS